MKYIYIIIVLFLFSCTNNQTADVITIDLPWNINNSIKYNDLIKDIEAIPLQSNKEPFLGMISSFKVDKDGFYIFDFRNQQVLRFNHDGSYSNYYGELGRASNIGEYSSVRSFCTDDMRLYLIDNSTKKLFIYNKLTGDFINSMDMPFYAYDIEKIDSLGFILAWSNVPNSVIDNNTYRITMCDSTLNIKRQLFKPTDEDSYMNKFAYLTKTDSVISYQFFYTDTIRFFNAVNGEYVSYVLKSDLSIPNDKKINKNIYEDSGVNEYNYIGAYTGSPILYGNYIIDKLKGKNDYGVFAYDLNNKEYIFVDKIFNKLLDPLYSYNGFIYSCVPISIYNKALKDGIKLNQSGEITETTDFVVIKYKLI